MSAMQSMLESMLSKFIPPEITAMITPENIERVTGEASAFVKRIDANFADIRTRLERLENGGRTEQLGSDGSNGDGATVAGRLEHHPAE